LRSLFKPADGIEEAVNRDTSIGIDHEDVIVLSSVLRRVAEHTAHTINLPRSTQQLNKLIDHLRKLQTKGEN
jgi:hypothetical protein